MKASLGGQRLTCPHLRAQRGLAAWTRTSQPVECSAATSVKLPATHLQASQQALQQLKASKQNRER